MPVAAPSIRAAASPSDHDTAGGGPPARPGICPEGATEILGAEILGAEVLGAEMLVVGYLSAVAAALDERGIVVRTRHLYGLGGQGWGRDERPGVGVLHPAPGTRHLRPAGTGLGLGWGPTEVDWHQDTGWSARLRRGISGGRVRGRAGSR